MWVQSLSQEDPLGKEMATHSSILAWRIHGQTSLEGYSPWGCKESDITELLSMRTLREWGGRKAKRARKVAWVGMRKELESM